METTVPDTLVGRMVDGRYRIEARIARGGMATVYRALDTRLDRVVAIKVMHSGLAADSDFVSRFTREARSAARLSHPHVVAVFDQGIDLSGDIPLVFLAMEYVDGSTLRDLLRSRGRLPPREALDILEPVLAALAAAHRAGLVHRDVKPENVLLAQDGRVKVADFGLARATGGDATQPTKGVLMGTVAYLAPEQVERGIADPRSDVYAAGIVAFEMLTGSVPYSGETPLSVAYQHVNGHVPAPSSRVAGLTTMLDPIVQRATSRDPDDRPIDAAAMLAMVIDARLALPSEAAAVAAAQDVHQTVVVTRPAETHDTAPVPLAVPMPPGGPGDGGDDPTRPPRPKPSKGLVALLLVLALAIAAGTAAWYLGTARYTDVPSLVGLTKQQAESKLSKLGLSASYGSPAYSESIATGQVVSTSPSAGGHVRDGSHVTLILSKGPERYAVPTLTGLTLSQARQKLQATKLRLGSTNHAYSTTVPKGQVVSSSPSHGASVRPATPVDVVVSKGPPPVDVPNVVGTTYNDAKAALKAAGLSIARSGEAYDDNVPAGSVVSQSPAAATTTPAGGTVSVVVSKGPPLVQVPSVLRMDVKKAEEALTKAGFHYVLKNECVVFCVGVVVDQSPNGGDMAPKGSLVTLTVV